MEEYAEEEAHVEPAAEVPSNDEFIIEQFYFILVGTTFEGSRIVDPSLLPLFLEGLLHLLTLPSPTPLGEMEEGEIPL